LTNWKSIISEETKRPEVPEEGKITQIMYTLKVNRMQLCKCFKALENLAEKSGELKLVIEAQTKKGIDVRWLKNAVEEPIEKAGVKKKTCLLKHRQRKDEAPSKTPRHWWARPLGRLTADKRPRYTSPKLPSATSFIRKKRTYKISNSYKCSDNHEAVMWLLF
jgi:hypothetical protein